MKIYRLFIKLAFGDLVFHSAGSLFDITAMAVALNQMGIATIIQ